MAICCHALVTSSLDVSVLALCSVCSQNMSVLVVSSDSATRIPILALNSKPMPRWKVSDEVLVMEVDVETFFSPRSQMSVGVSRLLT